MRAKTLAPTGASIKGGVEALSASSDDPDDARDEIVGIDGFPELGVEQIRMRRRFAGHRDESRRILARAETSREGQSVLPAREAEIHHHDIETDDGRSLQRLVGRRRHDAPKARTGEDEEEELARIAIVLDDQHDAAVRLAH